MVDAQEKMIGKCSFNIPVSWTIYFECSSSILYMYIIA